MKDREDYRKRKDADLKAELRELNIARKSAGLRPLQSVPKPCGLKSEVKSRLIRR